MIIEVRAINRIIIALVLLAVITLITPFYPGDHHNSNSTYSDKPNNPYNL
jgi:hypothetical protein